MMMPYELDYTDENDTNYPRSFWVIRHYSANDVVKTGQLHFFGYASVADFDAGNPEIGTQDYTITDPAVYDAYFGQAHVPTVDAFLTILELIGANIPTPGTSFFNGAIQLSSVRSDSLEIGLVNTSRVVVVFTADVDKQVLGDFDSGVTIKVNGVDATISSATQTGAPTTLQFNLSAPVDQNDVVTWEYDASMGFLIDAAGLPLQTFMAIEVSNLVGTTFDFSESENSGLFAMHF
jgi:hypothetical protein